MSTLTIERLGGLVGFGHPGSNVKSRGQVEWEQLSARDRKAIDELFAQHRGAQQSVKSSPVRDAFVYRLSRSAGKGAESVEVSEECVPVALLQYIRDELA
ncbi:MAG TPA: protealysin inhibitor emfourin [Steroidobacteraceae bacterium]|nr:protealysin inhibitor emfourin [Steroidobacteraceae bacterium]